MSDVTIRTAESDADRDAAITLRREVYTAAGSTLFTGPDRAMEDEADRRATWLIAEHDGNLVACARLVFGSDSLIDDHLRQTYNLDWFDGAVSDQDLVVVDRGTVHPEYRGGDVRMELMYHAAIALAERNIFLCVINSQPHLLPLYTSMGFRPYGAPYDTHLGVAVNLAIVAADLEHLRKTGSDFLSLAETMDIDPDVGQQLTARLPDPGPVRMATLTDTYVEDIGPVMREFGIESEALLRRSFALDVPPGVRVIVAGQEQHTPYLIASGSLDVYDNNRFVASIYAGEFVGDVGFLLESPRMSDVYVGHGGATLIGFSVTSLRGFIAEDPDAAAWFFHGMAAGLARKLVGQQRTAAP